METQRAGELNLTLTPNPSCACGCGREVSRPNNRYVIGHVRKKTPEHLARAHEVSWFTADILRKEQIEIRKLIKSLRRAFLGNPGMGTIKEVSEDTGIPYETVRLHRRKNRNEKRS